MASVPSSSTVDDCINKAADFLSTCDNVQCREGCVSILLEVLSNSSIVSRVSPRTLQKLVSSDDRLRRHIQRAVIVSRTPPSPQLNLRELSRLVETVSPPDSILVIRRLDRLKGDMHALQQAIMVDPQDVIMWPAPPRGNPGSHKLPGMAFLTCLKGRDSAEEILRCCGGLISIKRSDGPCVPDWAIVLGPDSCPYGRVVALPFSSFTWPKSPVLGDYLAAFYSSVLFVFILFAVCATFLKRSKLWFELVVLFFTSWAVQTIAKKIAEMERPRGSCHITCGMPSGHALMSMSIMMLLLLHYGGRELLTLASNLRSLDIHNIVLPREARLALKYISFILLIFVPIPWSRVKLNDHSPWQVTIGCGLGILLGVVWFTLSTLSNAGCSNTWKAVSSPKRSQSNIEQVGEDV
ncbi:hypothetical protein FOL47_008935 [Perkinsus chesapeaki]|uniref:Dolichyldiphosphatase 1 n=1 Tax=Perkinsus chesapeaki TaxID=330153 RepID=A0A7J6N333_PERCH|nr:hypothetical protein FOL47_008935 [Perkinsus chesapeaki]